MRINLGQRRSGREMMAVVLLLLTAAMLLIFPSGRAAAASDLTITVWYGDEQLINTSCLTQQYANILGEVSSSDEITALSYTLNGGPATPLEVGPTLFRLAADGDFNVDIPLSALQAGDNRVIITAEDAGGAIVEQEVTLTLAAAPLPTSTGPTQTVAWNAETLASGQAVIIDGYWELTDDGIFSARSGYDRLIGICPMDWQNYELTVPVTIHAIEPRKDWPSNGSGVGLAFHWNGHENWNNVQPQYGWYPIGGFNYLNWDYAGERTEPLESIVLNGDLFLPLDQQLTSLQVGETYWFKLRAEHVPGYGSLYYSKVWLAGEEEPTDWLLSGEQYAWHPYYGSILLVSHHALATFGTVEITNLDSPMTQLLDILPFLAVLPLALFGLYALYQGWRGQSAVAQALRRPLLAAGGASLLFALGKPAVDLIIPRLLHDANQGFKLISAGMTAVNLILALLLAGGLIWLIRSVLQQTKLSGR